MLGLRACGGRPDACEAQRFPTCMLPGRPNVYAINVLRPRRRVTLPALSWCTCGEDVQAVI